MRGAGVVLIALIALGMLALFVVGTRSTNNDIAIGEALKALLNRIQNPVTSTTTTTITTTSARTGTSTISVTTTSSTRISTTTTGIRTTVRTTTSRPPDTPPGWVCDRDGVVCLKVLDSNVSEGEELRVVMWIRYRGGCGLYWASFGIYEGDACVAGCYYAPPTSFSGTYSIHPPRVREEGGARVLKGVLAGSHSIRACLSCGPREWCTPWVQVTIRPNDLLRNVHAALNGNSIVLSYDSLRHPVIVHLVVLDSRGTAIWHDVVTMSGSSYTWNVPRDLSNAATLVVHHTSNDSYRIPLR